MYLYTFENHKCPKSPYRADKNDIFKKHQKSPIKSDFLKRRKKFFKKLTFYYKFYIILVPFDGLHNYISNQYHEPFSCSFLV